MIYSKNSNLQFLFYMTTCIHQPDFVPWLGFFNKIKSSNCFIIFDHVQASQGKSWLSRNRILLNGEPYWLTVPVNKSNKCRITEVVISDAKAIKRKHLGTLNQAYKKAKYFDEIFSEIEIIYMENFELLADFNLKFIKKICSLLLIKPKIISSTEICDMHPYLLDLNGNDLVLELCKVSGTNDYLSGNGCTDFIKPDSFLAEGIKFRFQDFSCNPYQQIGVNAFVSHMSIIDALFNAGPAGVSNLI